jgi:tetratricopeptide (TPR) repeat protein
MLLSTYARSILMIVVISLASKACQEDRTAVPPTESFEADTASSAELGFDGRTTNGDVAANNLSSQITGRTTAAQLRPTDMVIRAQLVELLLSRAQYLGRYSDFDHVILIAHDALIQTENTDDAKLIRAQVASALHQFALAQDILSTLREPNRIAEVLASTIRLATNTDLLSVRAARQERAEAYPNYANLSAWAAVESGLGNYEQADALYIRALQSYGDVSPFPVAWIQFQRGVMWAESADQPQKALPLYREAVARLPGYVVANVHLAELEAEMGQEAQAIDRLRRIVTTTEDPEPAGLLGEILLRSNPDEGSVYIEQARRGYNHLLDLHPAAFADHGAEFFSGPGGEPKRALSLALANVQRRPTQRAYVVAIEVAEAAGENRKACDLAQEVGSENVSMVLKSLVARILEEC